MKRAAIFLMRATDHVPPPREWMLEVTNRCNLACPMCPRDKVDFVTHDMEIPFIRRLLESNSLPAAIWPYGFGEPLMYSQLFTVIRYFKEKRIVVSLSTNATYLNQKVAQELLASKLDYLILAFDGATADTYAKHRRGASFHAVRANIERFLSLKVKTRSVMHVTLQMILMQSTEHEVPAFRKLWNRPGVDCVRIRPDLSQPHSTTNAVRLQERRRPCFFLWRGPLFIQAAGTTIPCPYYHGSKPFGDLRSQTIEQAWNSAKMIELRRAHVEGDLSRFPTCETCPRYQPHPLVAAASFLVGTRGIRKYMPLAEKIQNAVGRTFFE